MRSSIGTTLACVLLVALSPPPAHASGETLAVNPGSGSAGTVVRMTYSMDGGCGEHEVAEFFFDANPVGRAVVDQQGCRAVLRFTVPATSCTSHGVSAAWHYPGIEQLYGLATSRFTVTRRGDTCRRPPSPTPSPTRPVRTSAPVPAVTSPPARSPSPRPSAVPAVTSAPPIAAGQDPKTGSGGGLPAAVGVLAALGAVGALVLLARRRRTGAA
jgi:LPXTG-motif cell wall-anchored protein